MDGDDRLRALAASPEVLAYLAQPRTGLYIARRDGHILWASASMRDLFGHDPATLVGRNAWEIFPAREDLDIAAQSSALLNEGDLAVWLPLLRSNGTKAWFRLDALNREGGVVLAFREELDPTQQRFHTLPLPGVEAGRAEAMRQRREGVGRDVRDDGLEALLASNEVRAFLRMPGTGVYVVRADGHIVWASPSMFEVTGHRPEDLLGRNGWDVFVPPEDLADVAHFRALLAESDGTVWMRLRMPDEGRNWFRVDTLLRRGHIVCAFHREPDPQMHFPHRFMRPRPRGA